MAENKPKTAVVTDESQVKEEDKAPKETPEPPRPQSKAEIWKEGMLIPQFYFQPTRVDFLVPIKAENYYNYPYFGEMPPQIRTRIVALLPIDLPVELVSDVSFMLTKDFEEDLRELLKLSAPWVHNIDVRKLPSHLQLLILNHEMPMNLSSLKIEYGNPGVGLNYDIKDFGINNSDCMSMAALLSVTLTLTELNLSSSLLSDDHVRILCDGMVKNPTIVNLDLSHNLISDAGCSHLAKYLDAKDCVLLFLNLANNKIRKIGTRTIGYSLSANKTLLSLNLRLNDLGDYGGHRIFDYMMDNQVIKRLSMAGTGFDVKGIESLAKLLHLPQSELIQLDISANPGIGPTGGQMIYTGLVAMKKMKELNVKQCNIGSELEMKIEKLLLARKFDEEDLLLNPQI